MSDLAGKWELIAVENVKEYCEAIGSSPDYVEKALQFLTPDNDITQTICFHDNGVSITTEMPGKITKVAGNFGQPIETQFLDDRPIKTVFRLDGNFLREEQTGAFTSSNVRYVEDGQMIYKMTCGDVTTTRRYKRL